MTSLNSLIRITARPSRRVGRGGKRGKTSGRGTKGQNARSGRKKRPELRDIIKKLPKRRGYGKNRGRTVDGTKPAPLAISLGRLETLFDSGSEVTLRALADKGVIRLRKMVPVKVVGGGTIGKKLTIKGLDVSASARVAIEKAGGVVA